MSQVCLEAVTSPNLAREGRHELQVQLSLRSAPLADQVLMTRLLSPMPLRHSGVKVDVLDKALLLQKLHRAIDRGHVDLWETGVHPAVHIVDGNMPRD